ncbi:MAG: hypothetical protein ACO3K7_06760 [Candidatus Marinamargulisbacteria bacterium]
MSAPIFDPLPWSIPSPNLSVSDTTPSPEPNLEDPEAMYDQWLKPNLNNDDMPFKKDTMVGQLDAIFKLYLQLDTQPLKRQYNARLNDISIQVTLYEALIFRDLFMNTPTHEWALTATEAPTTFLFKTSTNTLSVDISKTALTLTQDNRPLGQLAIDMGHIVVEKLHGTLFNAPFIVDPIWINKHRIDAVKLQIDQYKTEIVHKKKHKDTIWTGGNRLRRMTISKNKTIEITPKLRLNCKKIHWQHRILTTLQWHTPWYRFPIQGVFKITP